MNQLKNVNYSYSENPINFQHVQIAFLELSKAHRALRGLIFGIQ